MIPVEAYVADLLAGITALEPVEVDVADALGCVLADDVVARHAVPPFTNSAMDGFALRAADLGDLDPATEAVPGADSSEPTTPITLPVAGDIAAGDNAVYRCEPGQAWRIMTGARVPEGADTVVKVEDTTTPAGIVALPDEVTILRVPRAGANVRHAGEDCRVGDVIIRRGEILSPAALSSAASVGYARLKVRPRVRVGVVSTGDELVSAGNDLDLAQIPDSNSVLLRALLERADADVVTVTHSGDDAEEFAATLARMCADVDLIVTSGGVSAGAYDVVKAAADTIDLRFNQVAMQPGKPQGFGRVRAGDNSALLCALPGNPVSVFVSFHVFVRPVLAALTGRGDAAQAVTVAATTSSGWRSPAGKRQFVPVHVTWPRQAGNTPIARPTHRLGSRSHFVASLHEATGLAVIAEDVTDVAAWSIIDVIVV
ncbi:molybdopterin molybdotransferase MoeA [Nanchangia anserum]|uniref:Molybdopterin molybdenumtransferase n=1 Tax=Nanchangia anserum TaxID=2692125 RepID=A0A8I0G757_9ACTO|nr:gephyrin-like molybdotransferase Glp [Nanchangia anserum]MBD3689057.1 molybdopterin molybdotransferase MoeA [Nanchangia anserum]QOX81299.1 molybdopterin molybdotransferase MoeA [Nanchangia anserum]